MESTLSIHDEKSRAKLRQLIESRRLTLKDLNTEAQLWRMKKYRLRSALDTTLESNKVAESIPSTNDQVVVVDNDDYDVHRQSGLFVAACDPSLNFTGHHAHSMSNNEHDEDNDDENVLTKTQLWVIAASIVAVVILVPMLVMCRKRIRSRRPFEGHKQYSWT